MIYGERIRRELHIDTKGMTAKITVLGDWSSFEDDYDSSLPGIGDPWTSQYPYLRCVDITAEEIAPGIGELVAQFSTERQLAESFVDIEKEFATRSEDITRGWEWETAGTKVEQQVPSEVPVTIWNVRVREQSSPSDAIQSAMNKVNSAEWNGVAAGYLRFIGARQSSQYDMDGALISVDTVYTFEETVVPANWFWREPVVDVDADGNELIYQNKDSAKTDTYTTDTTKVGTRKYVSGTAGTGGFDRMLDSSSNLRYQSCDFALVLGIPG